VSADRRHPLRRTGRPKPKSPSLCHPSWLVRRSKRLCGSGREERYALPGTWLKCQSSRDQGSLAESALASPAAGFGGYERYPSLAAKAAVLLQHVARNHALPDGNKRTALLCAILFANLNGLDWEPPEADDPDGKETAEIVEATAASKVPSPHSLPGSTTGWPTWHHSLPQSCPSGLP
jgi:prophage maintenance system killer protein